ncbi:hypothetical protein pv_191 [Pithovirus sibericum]|uniref:Uncharacterized protein n=1 Tax=Pithovirus sibericum TaxID=1450746 RepID=W5S4S0_9VIRU|nr:hypothetical protein pv_191 [Pithovirus sibericum]AHH01758.1 hypothetical protein pv_191 [Pithovirus sibericum]
MFRDSFLFRHPIKSFLLLNGLIRKLPTKLQFSHLEFQTKLPTKLQFSHLSFRQNFQPNCNFLT